MTAAKQFRVNEVFDIAARGGLVAVGMVVGGELAGLPHLRDEATGRPVRVLGVDHPTPRTQRTGETILVVDRADAEVVAVGRVWVVSPAD
ncbi:hypothetical protein [Actinoplanes sp. NBRC 103695]|uniref:hypothetical protein n=1 Tax=Actinoplanes sp. NBRC 103695 TaxID=3032202 RepID=UPI0024A12C9E|nr:hypothetical protein [Actinoplanes sp. NBRC 103695]GLY92816.1 hypothetical protein Acsp02_00720 [Actinoplanes sp. NBRC 103695]